MMKYLIWLLIPCLLFAEDGARYGWRTGNTGDVIITDDDGRRMKLDLFEYLDMEEYYCEIIDPDLDSDTLFVFINTPATGYVYLDAGVSSSGAGSEYLYEIPAIFDSTDSGDGTGSGTEFWTEATIYNVDRQCGVTTSVLIYYWLDGSESELYIDAANLGTLLQSEYIYSEWLLKQNTQYLIIFISDGDNNEVMQYIGLYEGQ